MSAFDDYYNCYPDYRGMPDDWELFWKNNIKALKKIAIDPAIEKMGNTMNSSHNAFRVKYYGVESYKLIMNFYANRLKKRSPLIIYFPDYHSKESDFKEILDEGFNLCVLQLRGEREKEIEYQNLEKEKDKPESYGFFAENLLNKDHYYMYYLYMDAVRTIDVIKLKNEFSTENIYLWGNGTGAAMALMANYANGDIGKVFLQNPSFCYLDETQNVSTSFYSKEINGYIKKNKNLKKTIKQNLSYFDALYFAKKFQTPVAFGITMNSDEKNQSGAFALFHAIAADKKMFLYNEFVKSENKISKIIGKDVIQFFKN